MAVFNYKAKNKQGKIEEGVLVGSSEKEIGKLLINQQLSPLSVKKIEDSKKMGKALFGSHINLIEKANFCRYLSTMINSGLPLSEAIEVISAETSQPKMMEVLSELRTGLQEGQTLSSAFSKYPAVFDEVFLTLVKAGEESGTLGKSLDYLGKQLYSDYELQQRVKSTLAYPSVIVFATGCLGLAMLFFVVPKIAPILIGLNESFPLPSYTLMILQVSLFISQKIIFIIPAIIILSLLVIILLCRPTGKKMLGDLFSRIPVFGELFAKLALGRFSRTLSTLLKSGVPIISALKVSSSALTLPQFKNVSEVFIKDIEKGVSLSEALRKTKVFPQIMIRMVATGEKTGALDKLLLELAEFYEEEVSNTLKTLTSVLEPIMMLLIGVGVGVMVILVIAPIYSFVGSLSKGISAQ